MPYNEREQEILKKYRIMNPDGSLREVDLRQPQEGRPLGPGPIIAVDAINQLIRADKSPDQRWLDWIFFQAGGGAPAVQQTTDVLRQIKERFVDERVNGWTHPESGVYQPPVTREQAEARWVANEPRFRLLLEVTDQDAVRLNVFCYFRNWPGKAGIYETVTGAVTKFLRVYPLLLQMNKEIVAKRKADKQQRALRGDEPEAEQEEEPSSEEFTFNKPEAADPEDIKSPAEMVKIAEKVERYFAIKKARVDFDEKTIYEDDVIAAIAPLTYGASVRYGHEVWPWSSPERFDKILRGKSDFRQGNEWKERTSKGKLIVFLKFKAPVPGWVSRWEGEWQIKDLTDLSLMLDSTMVRREPDTWQVFDEENRDQRTIAEIKQMILSEPERQAGPEEEESPIVTGNVYKTAEEAQRVVASLDRALAQVQKQFAAIVKGVKSDVFKLQQD